MALPWLNHANCPVIGRCRVSSEPRCAFSRQLKKKTPAYKSSVIIASPRNTHTHTDPYTDVLPTVNLFIAVIPFVLIQ